MRLTEALQNLQQLGLKLVFSSAVVRPEMTVRARPASTDPRTILEELLAPHGLTVVEGPGGVLIVVARGGPAVPPTATAAIHGTVRSRHALAPLPGVSIQIPDRGVDARTDEGGRFAIEGLAPGTFSVEARRPGFVIERREAVTLAPGATADVSFLLQPAPLTREEVVVHPSRIALIEEQPAAPFSLDREQISSLPHLGADVFRALSLLPGITSNDITAQFHVRGGRRDEVRVVLDGQELYDAYHLKEFDNALAVVAASNLANVDLSTGAFPSSYGDRMGGILDLSTVTPSRPRRLRVSLSVLNAELEGSGGSGDRVSWLLSARRGNTDLAGRVFGAEDPSFWDLFGKLDYRATERQSFRLNVLHSSDELDFVEDSNGEITRFDTDYGSSYAWLTHGAVASDRLFVDTALSAARVDRNRRGGEDEEEKEVEVRDERDLQVTGLQQSWSFQADERHSLKAGVEARRFQADYDYESSRVFRSPLTALRSDPESGDFAFRDRLTDDYLGTFLSDRITASPTLTLEVGLRFDRHTLTDDSVWSPRANLAWKLGGASVLRVGWGWYSQSQRAYEFAVEDADTSLHPAERAEHWVVGFEHLFDANGSSPLAAVRAEVYRRRVSDPRPRYENRLEPFEPLPEGAFDRYRIEPGRAVARGIEIFLRGRAGSRLEWWANYGYASTEDEIAGEKVPRQIEQRSTVNVDVNCDLGRRWSANLAWRFHSGWRITPVSLGEEDGELVPVAGRSNSDHLPEYHRLDVRVSRRWPIKAGSLTVFADVQNLYNRGNVAGYDLEIDEEARQIVANPEPWPGIFGSAGISLEF